MAKAPSSWLDDKVVGYHYPALTLSELVNVWQTNRNSLTSAMAADEVMKRIHDGKIVLMESDTIKELMR